MARTINVARLPVDRRHVGERRVRTFVWPEDRVGPARRLEARLDARRAHRHVVRGLVARHAAPPVDAEVLGEGVGVDARRAAYSLLLTNGLIRVGLPVPPDAEFTLCAVDDPTGYAGNNPNDNELSLFRRPLPATNLRFLSTVMWDGRETLEKGSAAAIHFDLAHQANSATQGHAEAPDPIDETTREAILAYGMGLFTAQVFDRTAGALTAAGVQGWPVAFSTRPFVFGVNDSLGCDPPAANCDPASARFDPIVFTEYDAWMGVPRKGRNATRAAVARGLPAAEILCLDLKSRPL